MAASTAKVVKTVQSMGVFTRWMRRRWDEPKLGLLRDDYWYGFWEVKDHPIAVEAIRRLPHVIQAERSFRMKRALHYSGRKELLPKSEWISIEHDMEHGSYLTAYINEVEKEFEERKMWNSKR